MLRRVLILAVGLGLVAWSVVWWVSNREFRTELQTAKRELGAQHLGEARARLVRLAERWPGRGDVQYWLGNCEMAAGNSDGALLAWARVPGGIPRRRDWRHWRRAGSHWRRGTFPLPKSLSSARYRAEERLPTRRDSSEVVCTG